MPTEILEMNESIQNDNIVESIQEINTNENHWRELVKAREKRLTEKDQVINNLELQIDREAGEQAVNKLSSAMNDKFTVLRHYIQDIEDLKEELCKKMVLVNDLIDDLEDHFI